MLRYATELSVRRSWFPPVLCRRHLEATRWNQQLRHRSCCCRLGAFQGSNLENLGQQRPAAVDHLPPWDAKSMELLVFVGIQWDPMLETRFLLREWKRYLEHLRPWAAELGMANVLIPCKHWAFPVWKRYRIVSDYDLWFSLIFPVGPEMLEVLSMESPNLAACSGRVAEDLMLVVFSTMDCAFNWPADGNEAPPNNLGYMCPGIQAGSGCPNKSDWYWHCKCYNNPNRTEGLWGFWGFFIHSLFMLPVLPMVPSMRLKVWRHAWWENWVGLLEGKNGRFGAVWFHMFHCFVQLPVLLSSWPPKQQKPNSST